MSQPVWWPCFLDRIERLGTLIPEAIEDGERTVGISGKSLENAKRFAAALVDVALPGTFIQHDGLTRLLWQSGGIEGVRLFSEQVAIKFRENDTVEFVLFRSEPFHDRTSDIMGVSHVDVILGIVSALGLDHVMKNQ